MGGDGRGLSPNYFWAVVSALGLVGNVGCCLCVCVETSGGMAVQLMRMIDTYSLTSARLLAPGQQKTVVGPGIGQFLLRHSTRTHHYLHHSTLFQLRW